MRMPKNCKNIQIRGTRVLCKFGSRWRIVGAPGTCRTKATKHGKICGCKTLGGGFRTMPKRSCSR